MTVTDTVEIRPESVFVVIYGGPGTSGAREGLEFAKDAMADLVLVADAVLLGRRGRLGGYCGTAYAVIADVEARGVTGLEKGMKLIQYDELQKILQSGNVIGTFN